MAEKDQGIPIPIEWCYPDNLLSVYATTMIVQHTEHEFILSFFEARPPIILGSPEEQKEQALRLVSVKADCVARVIVSIARMPNFVQILQDNLKKYEEKSNPAE